MRIGLYEEFPVPWRLDKLQKVDFPVTLALAAPSRDEFMKLRDEVNSLYPQVGEVYFWGLLSADELIDRVYAAFDCDHHPALAIPAKAA